MTEGVKMSKPILEVKNLQTGFQLENNIVVPVDGVSFQVKEGETLALVGESGCGKSVTSLSIMRLLAQPAGRILDGQILFQDRDLARCSEKEMQEIRGNTIAMIFQEPMTSLNPLMRIGDQIEEELLLHKALSKKQAQKRVLELLELVEIPTAKTRLKQYPHELSGGMRQRVMIAMALACNPKLLIADEPTTALDVTIQAQILDLLNRLQKELKMSIMMITHDLGVVAEVADHVLVMYAGTVVEYGTVHEIFQAPQHPYTKGLLRSLPNLEEDEQELYIIPGTVPNLAKLHQGCRFAPRCDSVCDACWLAEPNGYEKNNHFVRCLKDNEK